MNLVINRVKPRKRVVRARNRYYVVRGTAVLFNYFLYFKASESDVESHPVNVKKQFLADSQLSGRRFYRRGHARFGGGIIFREIHGRKKRGLRQKRKKNEKD